MNAEAKEDRPSDNIHRGSFSFLPFLLYLQLMQIVACFSFLPFLLYLQLMQIVACFSFLPFLLYLQVMHT
jgi:hypothetical protein